MNIVCEEVRVFISMEGGMYVCMTVCVCVSVEKG